MRSKYTSTMITALLAGVILSAPVKALDTLEIPKLEKPPIGTEVGVITTKFGKIIIKFRADKAPKHVESFIKLAKEKFFDTTIFHRVIPSFMIQGGDPNTKPGGDPSMYGMGGPKLRLKQEFNNLSHVRGVLSMARSNDPDSAGSQFFVVVKDSDFLDRQYTVFGEVVEGMDVADKIAALPRNENDLPDQRAEMTVTIEKYEAKK
jgi:peptidyl-prolyl cis-trans isomerase B (cyclophilin B)